MTDDKLGSSNHFRILNLSTEEEFPGIQLKATSKFPNWLGLRVAFVSADLAARLPEVAAAQWSCSGESRICSDPCAGQVWL
jgi:hypothetical protein